MASPAIPQERAKQHLPPKSYADAIDDAPPVVNGSNPASNGTHGANTGANPHDHDTNNKGHKASVLRIVNVDTPRKEKEKQKENGSESLTADRPALERQGSMHEYSAKGLDDTPRGSPKQKVRKAPSHRTMGSLGNNAAASAEKILSQNGKSESKVNGKDVKPKVNDNKPETTVFEKFEGHTNGSKLISVKPSADYEKQLQADRKERPLHSGRQAGQRWERSAIRWAPMNVPLKRRLQTLVVLFHTLCIALSVSVFFFLCAIPLFWPLLIPYMIYCIWSTASTSGTLSHRWNFLRSSPIWSLFAGYFPARLHRTVELPPTRKYIFGYHPHGIISHGAFAAFATEALGFSQLFPGIKNTLLTLDANFRIPIYRDYALAMGLASVSKESCENLLSKGGPNKEGMGRAITIVVGGARESLDAQPYSLRLVLKCRKGFIKMAIKTGADLVPVLAFGENDIYDQFQPESHPKIHRFQLLVKKLLGFTIPLFHARGVFNYDVGLMPYRRPLNIVVGPPVKVVRNPKPEQAEIDRVHEEYVRELERLWELWKDEFAPHRKEEMAIVE